MTKTSDFVGVPRSDPGTTVAHCLLGRRIRVGITDSLEDAFAVLISPSV